MKITVEFEDKDIEETLSGKEKKKPDHGRYSWGHCNGNGNTLLIDMADGGASEAEMLFVSEMIDKYDHRHR